MRAKLRLSLFRNQRGAIILFVLLSILFLLTVGGGLTADMARLISQKQEMQSSLDAAALAGAGKLGFDDSVFPTARDFAVDFADKNPTRGGPIGLNRNDANDVAGFNTATMPYGDVVLGIWDPRNPDGIGPGLRFEPSTDGSVVNSVMCRYKQQIPASFLSLWGLVNLTVATSAIATSAQPMYPPVPCVFPIGLSSCPFSQGEVFNSKGCGKPIKFVTSNGQADSSNTAAWINMAGTGTPSAADLRTYVEQAVNGSCDRTPPQVNTQVGTNNGMSNSVFTDLRDAFKAKFNASVADSANWPTIKNSDGDVVYHGPGWEVWVPVIQTACDANGNTQSIVGDHTVVGWTQFVMTQAWDSTGGNQEKIGLGCVVNNSYDSGTWPWCQVTDPAQLPEGLQGGASRSIFGIYACGMSNSPPAILPGPRSALATKLRLVR
jgi:hypothetical protein